MFQPAGALAHVYQTVVVVGHVAHHPRGSTDDAPEVTLQSYLGCAVGCLQGELIVVSLMAETAHLVIAQQEGGVVERVEVGSAEGRPVVRRRP